MAGRTQSIEEAINSARANNAAQTQNSAKAKEKAAAKAKATKLNQQINAIIADNKKILDAMKEPQFMVEYYRKQMVDFVVSLDLPADKTLWTAGQRATYAGFERDRNDQQKIVDGYKARLKTNNLKSYQLELDLQKITKAVKPPKPPVDAPPIPTTPPPTIYNAPLVSQAYFRGIQTEILNGNYVDAGNYADAMEAWSIDPKTGQPMGGRGTIQMDRQTNTAAVIATASKSTGFKNVDTTPYGFKFLYNPQTVGMSWGSIAQTDPVYQASSQDVFVAGTSNLVSSFIEFSILLNRIEDFNYLNKDGLISNPSTTSAYINTNTLAGIQAASTVAKSPYPQFASKNGANEEFKAIYEKGTMYDLEYLFKTMHGQGAYASYKSVLMGGTTSDPGWLPVRPVELHLGNKLRYRVRISNLSVNHTIFNSRMVPILSTVNITCARYWDGTGALTGEFVKP
jgi:hypothetical protein